MKRRLKYLLFLPILLTLHSCFFNYQWEMKVLGPANNSVIVAEKPVVPKVWGILNAKFDGKEKEKIKEGRSEKRSILPIKGSVFCNGVKGRIITQDRTWVVENVPLNFFGENNLVCFYNEPQYSSMQKLTIKYMPIENGQLTPNKVAFYAGEEMTLALQNQAVTENVSANIETQSVTLEKTNDSKLKFVVANLTAGDHKLSFRYNYKNYDLNFKVLSIPVISNPDEIVQNYKNLIISLNASLHDSMSDAERLKIQPYVDTLVNTINSFSGDEIKLFAYFLFVQQSELNRLEMTAALGDNSSKLCSRPLKDYWSDTGFFITDDVVATIKKLEEDNTGAVTALIKSAQAVWTFIAATTNPVSVLKLIKETYGFTSQHFEFINARSTLKIGLQCALVPYGTVHTPSISSCTSTTQEILSYRAYEKTKDTYNVCVRNVYTNDQTSDTMKKPKLLADSIVRLKTAFTGSLFEILGYDAPVELPSSFSSENMKAEPENLLIANVTGVNAPLEEPTTQDYFVTYKQWVKNPTTFTYRMNYALLDVAVFGTNFKGSLSSPPLSLSIAFLPNAPARGIRVRPDCNPKEGLTYFWTFGDGGTAQGFLVTHQYTNPNGGTFPITVMAKNAQGVQIGSTASASIFIPGGDKKIKFSSPMTKELCQGDPPPTPTPTPTPPGGD